MNILRALRAGSRGADVRGVQQFLRARSLYYAAADGRFGPKTAAAVIDYQTEKNLRADGVIGQQTFAAMLADGLHLVVDADMETPAEPPGLRPLTTNSERAQRWGLFSFVPAPESGNPEAIRITDDFEERRIKTVMCPVFARRVRLHEQVIDDYARFMDAIIAAGLRDRLLTHEGGFCARYIRGSRVSLSNHAWGSAFDVNYEWNRLGHTPAFVGQTGCVRELVLIGLEHGWFWGGWFRHRRDGMHFEHL